VELLQQNKNKELVMKKSVILLIGLLMLPNLLFGASIQEINTQAIELLKLHKPKKAFEFLEKEYKNGNFDNQTLFLLGTAAKEANDWDNAIKYFEELLKRDGGAQRVRLDLAMVYYKKGDLKKAKDLLLIVKASNPPKKVGDNIDMFLSAIEQGAVSKNWSITLSAGYMYDSNVNNGPDADTVLMYNLPFKLSDDAKEREDYARTYGAVFNYSKALEDLIIQSTLSLKVTDYDTLQDYDSNSLSASVGPTWKRDKITFSMPVIVNVTTFGHNDPYYSISEGLSPQVSYQLNSHLLLLTSLSVQRKTYYQNRYKENYSGTLSPSIRYFFSRSSYFDLGGYYGKLSSRTKTDSNISRGANFGYYKAFTKRFNMYLNTSYSYTDYEGTEVAYGKGREDESRSIGCNLSYFIPKINVNAMLSASYTDNWSNIEMYKYIRKIVGFTLSKSF